MIHSDLKKHYSRFLKGHEGKLHFAAHSHHFWPDVSREGHLEYWDHCALTSDEKWNKIFSEVIPTSQKNIAGILNLKNPGQITFAPNTHELTSRLLSLFLGRKELRILTTESEFHSWNRQITRLEELPEVKITKVKVDENLVSNLKNELKNNHDLFFVSQVFFDSGIALTDQELLELSQATPKDTIMAVDGYHAFAAIPTNLEKLEGKIFYFGGGYKYAQAGEGACFIVVPTGEWRPAYTGWFAGFGDLGKSQISKVPYAVDGMSFMGATQDLSGLYRFNSVWNLFAKEGITVPEIHAYVKSLQEAFIAGLSPQFLKTWSLSPLYKDLMWHGHFLTFEARDEERAEAFEKAVKGLKIIIDRRGTRLRFGFGLYQDLSDVNALLNKLNSITD